MKEANRFFKKFQDSTVGGINTCMIGQIERFDSKQMKADVTLLPEGQLVIEVPVMTFQTGDFYIRVPYEPGDKVAVIFAQRDIDGILRGGDANPSQRKLSLDDAIVMGGINLYTDEPLPEEDAGDLVIGKRNKKSKIVMKADTDDIEVTCKEFKVNGKVI